MGIEVAPDRNFSGTFKCDNSESFTISADDPNSVMVNGDKLAVDGADHTVPYDHDRDVWRRSYTSSLKNPKQLNVQLRLDYHSVGGWSRDIDAKMVLKLRDRDTLLVERQEEIPKLGGGLHIRKENLVCSRTIGSRLWNRYFSK